MKRKTKISDRTLQRWWRLAVLKFNHNRCAVCGSVKTPQGLECHHLVKRRHRMTRNDYRNGVPVCVGECHRIADTSTGTATILQAHLFTGDLEKLANVNVKDYRMAHNMSRYEHESIELETLKTIASGGEL